MKNIQNPYHRLRASMMAATLAMGLMAGAEATVIGVSPSATHVGIGQSFAVSFDIQDLTGAANGSLSSFDLNVLYDAALLRLTAVHFSDPATGRNQLDFSEVGGFGFLGGANALGGRIDLFGLSGNSASVLDAAQADAFRFASLTFEALGPAALTTIANPARAGDGGVSVLNRCERQNCISFQSLLTGASAAQLRAVSGASELFAPVAALAGGDVFQVCSATPYLMPDNWQDGRMKIGDASFALDPISPPSVERRCASRCRQWSLSTPCSATGHWQAPL